MSATQLAILAALPWIALPLVVLWRLRRPVAVESYPADPPASPPLVSVIVPARDEARNIEACTRSILAGTWPAAEVIIVNDHSTDGTGEIAQRMAAADSRVIVVDNPDLPNDWFGKQWACHNGAKRARGTFLLFTDADTRHGSELLARAINAMGERRADLLTVAGTQMMETFWERLLQPHIFGILAARFGDFERVNRSTNPFDKFANGQFLLMRREVYDRAGGHEAVRTHVAEDLRFAQEWTRLGYNVQILAAFDSMTTRMYEGFAELWRGWGKNLWAGGRDTIAVGPAVKLLVRVAAPLLPLWEIAPAVALALAMLGLLPAAVGIWAAIAVVVNTAWWMLMHVAFRAPVWMAVLHPIAAVVLMAMFARAVWRGDRVEWKGRSYVSK